MRKIEIDCSSERTPERTSSSRIWAVYCQAKHGLEAGGAAFGEQGGDRGREHVVGLVDVERHPATLVLGQRLLGLDRALHEPQQQLEEQPGVVLAGDGLGAVDDDHLAAGDRAFEVEAVGVAQHDVDLRC